MIIFLRYTHQKSLYNYGGTDFLATANVCQTSILYQHLTTLIFNAEISKAAKVEAQSSNAMGYATRYVCHHLRKQLEHCSHKLKRRACALFDVELTTSKDSAALNTDEDWTARVDRGGLWYMKNTTYLLSVEIEEEVRKCLLGQLTNKIVHHHSLPPTLF